MQKFWDTVQYNRSHPELYVEKPKRVRQPKPEVYQECLIVSDPEDEYLSEDEL